MNANPEKPILQMPVTKMPDLLKATPIEEDIEKLQFRSTASSGSAARAEGLKSTERQSADKKAAIDVCIRTGEVMKALFPEGVQLKNESEFAMFRLFDRLVGDIAHFAQSGMTRQAALRDISLHAVLLENVIASRDQP